MKVLLDTNVILDLMLERDPGVPRPRRSPTPTGASDREMLVHLDDEKTDD
jgi:hypothetical protein